MTNPWLEFHARQNNLDFLKKKILTYKADNFIEIPILCRAEYIQSYHSKWNDTALLPWWYLCAYIANVCGHDAWYYINQLPCDKDNIEILILQFEYYFENFKQTIRTQQNHKPISDAIFSLILINPWLEFHARRNNQDFLKNKILTYKADNFIEIPILCRGECIQSYHIKWNDTKLLPWWYLCAYIASLFGHDAWYYINELPHDKEENIKYVMFQFKNEFEKFQNQLKEDKNLQQYSNTFFYLLCAPAITRTCTQFHHMTHPPQEM